MTVDGADDRSKLLLLAQGVLVADVQDLLADDHSGHVYAALVHGLLRLYAAAAREVRTEMGLLALSVVLEDIAADDSWRPDEAEAARLIIAYGSVVDDPGRDDNREIRDFGVQLFNEVIERADAAERAVELLWAVSQVWRRIAPELHTTEGLQILRHVEW